MSELKVLEIGKYYYPYRGGFEMSIYSLVKGLKDKCKFVILAAHTKCKTLIEDDGNVKVIRMACFGTLLSQPIVPSLFIWLRRIKADIIHLHLQNPLAMIAYLAVNPKGTLIVSYHSDVVRQKFAMIFFKALLKTILEKAHTIVVTSDNLINSSPVLQQFKEKCLVIPHGIDVDKFTLSSPAIAEESQRIVRSIGKPIVLFVGRLVYYKGLPYLIKAMKNIDAKLIVIGDGPLKYKFKLLARMNGVNHKIVWLGNVPDETLISYYHASSIFVLPSCVKSESFGIVILEAQAAGKPVVSTDLPTGVTFTNLHQKTGLIVPPGNSQSLAEAVNRLLESKELREEYGGNGKARVRREFTEAIMAKKFLTLYNSISNN